MQAQVTISNANEADLAWVNQQYKAVDFKPSCFENELIAIAKVDNKPIGVGRLQTIEDKIAELGGMYVDSAHRQQGIADKIVTYLLANSTRYEIVYCLPFAHLATFYQRFGFKLVTISAAIPQEVSAKVDWCRDTYDHPVLLHAFTNQCIK
jgi:N-acetylglutamate synthase-like GNAT family acetyltransferase